ncbi:unnamed protein product [Durusdinium trenchii]|uniref:Uncharacterized protein n=1 Tax=Durusdinium trenchii TaxID=1381693 RepID=A0ABP0SYJ9_9DINO
MASRCSPTDGSIAFMSMIAVNVPIVTLDLEQIKGKLLTVCLEGVDSLAVLSRTLESEHVPSGTNNHDFSCRLPVENPILPLKVSSSSSPSVHALTCACAFRGVPTLLCSSSWDWFASGVCAASRV